ESIRPGDDFYMYVNDAWLRSHPIPPDRSYYGYIPELRDRVDRDLLDLSLKAVNVSLANGDRNLTLIGKFYRSGMDTAAIERDGILSLQSDLAMINAVSSRQDLTNATVMLLANGSGPLYYYYADVNPRNSTEVIPWFYQGGLGLPDRDYYLKNDTESRDLQEKYRAHIARVFILMGEPDQQAETDAKAVYALEEALARSHFTAEENRVPALTTNVYPIHELQEKYPAIGWDTLSRIPGSGQVRVVEVSQPRYVEGLNTQLRTAPIDDWKAYLRYRLVDSSSPYLSTGFENENFAFYSRTLLGTEEMKPRWKRVIAAESESLGDLVGREYVAAYIDPRTRDMVREMFSSIRTTFNGRIENLTWMESGTKAKAQEKLAAMGEKIAYPDRWMDYSGLELSDSYAANVRSASAYALVHGPSGLDKIGRPVDPDCWLIGPQVVNAYYDPTRNEMVFPAAILQPPFFDPDAGAEQNYAILGWIIGHEMTHGFDDQGRQYDRDGTLHDWWTEEDAKEFTSRTAILVTEYNHFEVLPGLYLNGNLTLGENIADFGGLTLAYHAWKEHSPSPGPAGAGSPDRQFFISAATLWCENVRDDAQRVWILTDPHSASKYRVNGVVFNIPEFYEAFPEVRPGDALYRNVTDRPVIW
ncbi:MAG TPA: M13 family metallopeptidase, partial [Methanoregula sp.]|nr:M13 family metallopeptidase [Methanoregula sp.]